MATKRISRQLFSCTYPNNRGYCVVQQPCAAANFPPQQEARQQQLEFLSSDLFTKLCVLAPKVNKKRGHISLYHMESQATMPCSPQPGSNNCLDPTIAYLLSEKKSYSIIQHILQQLADGPLRPINVQIAGSPK